MKFKLTKRVGPCVTARPIIGDHNTIFQVAVNEVCVKHEKIIKKLALK